MAKKKWNPKTKSWDDNPSSSSSRSNNYNIPQASEKERQDAIDRSNKAAIAWGGIASPTGGSVSSSGSSSTKKAPVGTMASSVDTSSNSDPMRYGA